MAPRQTPAAVDDWQTVEPNDWQTVGAAPTPRPAPVTLPPQFGSDAFKAAVHSQMLGIDPGTAYQSRDEIDKQLRSQGGDYDAPLDDTILNDIKTGLQGSVFGLMYRNKMPDEVRNSGMIDKVVTGLTGFLADLPVGLAGSVLGATAGAVAGSEVPVVGNVTVGAVGAGAGFFALPAALRQVLVDGIQHGDVKGFGDLMHRAADVAWAATKGAVTGAATVAAEGVPVGSLIAKSGVASTAVKGMYQVAAMTTAGDVLDGHLPTASEFTTNAALMVPLNLVLHGVGMKAADAKQALMDVYVKDGTTPAETTERLNAQPPVKPDLPPGLKPAIKFEGSTLEADDNESHSEAAERQLGVKPLTMAELESDPTRADEVLRLPEIQEQPVIDRAVALKEEAIESGESTETPTIDELYTRRAMKSGRGFVTPDGKFLSREQAKGWMKKNEPDVHAMWADGVTGDKSAELHTEDYAAARNRVQNLKLAEGDATIDAVPSDVRRMLAEARSTGGILNKIKAGLASKGYGFEAIRTLLVGPRNFFRAEGEQVMRELRDLVPDKVERQGLHFFRDYRGELPQLHSDIEEIEAGDNKKLKAFLPAMKQAESWNGVLSENITKADQSMTDYFTKQLARGRALGTLNSGIDPSRYSPRMFMKAMEGGQSARGVGRPTFTDKTVNSIRREYLHTLDPLKEGDTEARTFDALDEMSIYNDRMATANSTAIFKTELKNSALGVERGRAKVPANWVPLTKQFEDKRTFVQEDGSSVTSVKNLYVPKDIADALKPLLEDPGQLSQLTKFLHVQSAIKGIELTLSAYHMKALTITAFNNLGLRDWLSAMHSDSNAPDTAAIEQRGALYGLTTTRTGPEYEAYKGLRPEEAPTGLAKLKDTSVVKAADATAKWITKKTFDVVQRKWKVMDWAKKEAGWIAKHPEATESEYGDAMRGYTKEVNAAYGGLNWDVMGASKGVQNVSRLFLLAPDWTFSNVANLKYAVADRGTAGAASRAFLVKSFVTGFAATAAASIFIGGKYDPTDVKHIDQVYLGTDKDGKEMYANWFFAGAPKDAMNLVKRSYSDGPVAGLAQVVVSKASPFAGAGLGLAFNKDYKGSTIYNREDDTATQTYNQAKYVGEKVLPISGVTVVQTVSDALTDPDHEYSYTDLLNLAADALGSPTQHQGSAVTSSSGNRNQRPAGRGKSRYSAIGRKR